MKREGKRRERKREKEGREEIFLFSYYFFFSILYFLFFSFSFSFFFFFFFFLFLFSFFFSFLLFFLSSFFFSSRGLPWLKQGRTVRSPPAVARAPAACPEIRQRRRWAMNGRWQGSAGENQKEIEKQGISCS